MKTLRRKQSRLARMNRHGATAVEFAIVAPIFFLVLMASIEFARLNVIRHTADNAAYEAARFAMVPGATASEAVSRANTILNSVGARGSTVQVNPAALGPDVDSLTVTIDVPLNANGWVLPRFTRGRTLTAQATMKTERVD